MLGSTEHRARKGAAQVEWWEEIDAMQMEEIALNWTKAGGAPKTNALMHAVIDGAKKRPNDDR